MSVPSVAHSSGTSFAAGRTNMPPSTVTDGASQPPPFGHFPPTVTEPMQVDANMPPTYTAQLENMQYTSYQLADREMAWREELSERLHASQQHPFLPDLAPQTQQHEFLRGTYDQTTFAVMQSKDDHETLRHNMVAPPLDPTAFRAILAEGADIPLEQLDTNQPATSSRSLTCSGHITLKVPAPNWTSSSRPSTWLSTCFSDISTRSERNLEIWDRRFAKSSKNSLDCVR